MRLNEIKEPYVLVIVHGRLGNMLFQLSAGLKYANDNNLNFYWAPLCTDSRRDYKKYIESNDFLNTIFSNLLKSYIDEEFFILRSNEHIKTSQEGFDNIYKYGFSGNAFNYKPIPKSFNIVLFGQFYNIKYIDSKLSRNAFSPQPEISREIKRLYGDISNYTSIHVRRGDYLREGILLDKSYYIKCISKFKKDTKFLVLSDDIEWCKQNFIDSDYTIEFADKKTNFSEAILDFYLMTKCENNICSKSTFSWWGAYLNNTINKKVLFPTSVGDILYNRVPKNWIKVYVIKTQLTNKVGNFFK